MNRVDPNILCGKLIGQCPADADHTVFGRSVWQVQWCALETRCRADVDQAAAPLNEMWNRGGAGVPSSDQVDVQHGSPLHLRRLVPGAHRQHTSVGHRRIQPTQLRDAVIDGRRQRRLVAHIDDMGDDPPAVLFGQPSRLRQILPSRQRVLQLRQRLADVDQDEVSPLLGQPHRMAAAQTPCCSGDQHLLAGDPAGCRDSLLLIICCRTRRRQGT